MFVVLHWNSQSGNRKRARKSPSIHGDMEQKLGEKKAMHFRIMKSCPDCKNENPVCTYQNDKDFFLVKFHFFFGPSVIPS